MTKIIIVWLLGLSLVPSALSQKIIYMDVSTDALLVVTDPAGKKTGIDPRFSRPHDQWIRLREIPTSAIGFEADDENATPFTHFEGEVNSPLGDGMFSIDLIGQGSKLTWLNVSMYSMNKDASVQEVEFKLENIPVEKDSVVSYVFIYHSPIGSSTGLQKIVSVGSLLRDISAMRKVGWITRSAIADKYVKRIRAYDTQIHQKNLDGARRSLSDILKGINADSPKNLPTEACKLLRADVESLMRQYH